VGVWEGNPVENQLATAPSYLGDDGGDCCKDDEHEERDQAKGRHEAPQILME
jgi:hypothetical protein